MASVEMDYLRLRRQTLVQDGVTFYCDYGGVDCAREAVEKGFEGLSLQNEVLAKRGGRHCLGRGLRLVQSYDAENVWLQRQSGTIEHLLFGGSSTIIESLVTRPIRHHRLFDFEVSRKPTHIRYRDPSQIIEQLASHRAAGFRTHRASSST